MLRTVLRTLRERGVRATVDTCDERIQAKIRTAADMKIPWLLVVGPRDAEANNVSVRMRRHYGRSRSSWASIVYRCSLPLKLNLGEEVSALKNCFPDVDFTEDA